MIGVCNFCHGSRFVVPVSIDVSTRNELATLARRAAARITDFSRDRPTKWQPGQIRNPRGLLDGYFTDAAAWDLIASKLEDGHPVEVIELEHPKGRTGYVMKIELDPEDRALYVKLQLGSGKIIGRSFHHSDYPQTHEEEED